MEMVEQEHQVKDMLVVTEIIQTMEAAVAAVLVLLVLWPGWWQRCWKWWCWTSCKYCWSSYQIGTPGPGPTTGGWLAGGGAGTNDGSHGPQTGGAGGGGGTTRGSAGTYATGGGGGGDAGTGALSEGGSGIVVIRYKIAELAGTAKASGGLISFTGSKTVHVFTSSGEFINTSGSSQMLITLSTVAVVPGAVVKWSRWRRWCWWIKNIITRGPGGPGSPTESTIPVSPGSPNKLTITVGAGAGASGDSVLTGLNGTAINITP